MARTLLSASSHRLSISAAVVTAAPFTLVGWGRPTSIDGSYHTLLSINNGSTSYQSLYMNTTGGASAFSNASGSSAEGTSGANVASANVWGHFAAVFASTTSRTGYFNGNAGTANTTSISPTGLNLTQIGTVWSGTNNWNGDVAECAVWNVALDQGELTALAAGVCPLLVRPTALVAYWPVIGQYSPEIDPVGRNELTLNGTPAAAPHCRILYPTLPQVWRSVVVAPTGQGRMFAAF